MSRGSKISRGAAVALAAAGILPGAAGAGVLSPGKPIKTALAQPGDEVRLSNERTITRWSTAKRRSAIHARPRESSRRVARLTYVASSKAREIYGVQRGLVDRRGRTWVQIRIPGRPNGRIGWTRLGNLHPVQLSRSLILLERGKLRATLYRNGRKVWRAPVGIGKASTPTPSGHYFIDRKEGAIFGPAYGPKVLFTNAYSVLPDWPGGGAVGMHGTNAPSLVPGRPSHGCIRVHNGNIERLWRMVRVGTPLHIR